MPWRALWPEGNQSAGRHAADAGGLFVDLVVGVAIALLLFIALRRVTEVLANAIAIANCRRHYAGNTAGRDHNGLGHPNFLA